jgi:hypothetical protein
MEARQAIQTGAVIFTDQIRSPLLVKRGEIIIVVSQSGGIRVRTTGRARQDGAAGELVQVETLETGERYEARVTGLREAAVFFAAPRGAGEVNADSATWASAPRPPRAPMADLSGPMSNETPRR